MFSYTDRPKYYQEDYEYSLYYPDEFHDYAERNFSYSSLKDRHSAQLKKPVVLPTVNYFNERKCPIYRHHVQHDSSVYNNYNQKGITPRKSVDTPKVTNQNVSKFVLDKLEETYWATWKPKKENLPVKKKSPRKGPNLGFTTYNKGNKKISNKPHGDANDNVIKYFKADEFESSSTAASVAPDKGTRKSSSSATTVSVMNENTDNAVTKKRLARPGRFVKTTQRDSVSQEIQTVVHCPVILEPTNENISENSSENKKFQVIYEMEGELHDAVTDSSEKVDAEDPNKVNEVESETQKQEDKNTKQIEKNKPKEKGKKLLKKKVPSKDIRAKPSLEKKPNNPDGVEAFVGLKDSIDIAKEKQMKSSREHYQQPKCIRLYKKSGGTSSFIKGGTYPLKSCLKKDSFQKGNFRLGAPGSPLFITTSSFSNKRKK